jgi:hypothetical protein
VKKVKKGEKGEKKGKRGEKGEKKGKVRKGEIQRETSTFYFTSSSVIILNGNDARHRYSPHQKRPMQSPRPPPPSQPSILHQCTRFTVDYGST